MIAISTLALAYSEGAFHSPVNSNTQITTLGYNPNISGASINCYIGDQTFTVSSYDECWDKGQIETTSTYYCPVSSTFVCTVAQTTIHSTLTVTAPSTETLTIATHTNYVSTVTVTK